MPDAAAPDAATLFDLIPEPAFIFDDNDLRFRAVNAAALERYGYSRREFLRLSILDLRPDVDRGSLHQELRDRQDEVRCSAVLTHATRSGATFPVRVVSRSALYDGRRSHCEVITDLTGDGEPSRAFGNRGGRFRAWFDHAPDAILFVNDDGGFVDANPAACALLERSRQEVLALKLWDIATDTAPGRGRGDWKSLLAHGTLQGSCQVVVSGGSPREVEYRAVGNVLPHLHLAILQDVTSRSAAGRASEQKLAQLNLQLRNLSARARARLEQDRTRLAREIHDQLGQSLAALKIDLFWLAGRIGGADTRPDTAAKIEAMIGLVDDTIRSVRRISSELRPPVLDQLGFGAALEWAVEDFQRRTGLVVALRLDLNRAPVDPGRSTPVFRIFQEILSNIAIHARATRVAIRVSTARKALKMTVEDDGCGIPADVIRCGGSLGLLGMQERAGLLGGTVVIRPATPHGTCVAVAIPLAERRRSTRSPSGPSR
jgi:PAS domain S-box-containing protein